jgi:hypothetical protein
MPSSAMRHSASVCPAAWFACSNAFCSRMPCRLPLRDEHRDPPCVRQLHPRQERRHGFAGRLPGFDDQPAAVEPVNPDRRPLPAPDPHREIDRGQAGDIEFARQRLPDCEPELRADAEASVLDRAPLDQHLERLARFRNAGEEAVGEYLSPAGECAFELPRLRRPRRHHDAGLVDHQSDAAEDAAIRVAFVPGDVE